LLGFVFATVKNEAQHEETQHEETQHEETQHEETQCCSSCFPKFLKETLRVSSCLFVDHFSKTACVLLNRRMESE